MAKKRLVGSYQGSPVIGTYDRLDACAVSLSFKRNDRGELEPEYEGSTDVWWDSQKTMQENGRMLLVTEAGDIVSEDEVEWKEEE